MTQSRKRLAHVVLTSVAICVGVFAAAAPAQAGVGLSITPDIVPNPAVVGEADIPANLMIASLDRTDAAGTATLSRIQLTMSCGDQGDSLGNCARLTRACSSRARPLTGWAGRVRAWFSRSLPIPSAGSRRAGTCSRPRPSR